METGGGGRDEGGVRSQRETQQNKAPYSGVMNEQQPLPDVRQENSNTPSSLPTCKHTHMHTHTHTHRHFEMYVFNACKVLMLPEHQC